MTPQIARSSVLPIRGWNSWQSYVTSLDEASALANAHVMAERLLPCGYDYFCIDGGWMGEATGGLRLDDFGRALPAKTRFPNGLKFVADELHRLGLKFGLHLMRGMPRSAADANVPIHGTSVHANDIVDRQSLCTWSDMCYGIDVRKPEGRAYYEGVIDLIASWGVDLLKVDDIVPWPDELETIAASIDRASARHGREIRLCLSPGNVVIWDRFGVYFRADSIRLTPDIWDRRADLERSFDSLREFTIATAVRRGRPPHHPGDPPAPGPHGRTLWPDLDMIPFGHLMLPYPAANHPPGHPEPFEGFERHCSFSLPQKQSFLTLRALACSPLLLGGALVDLPEEDFALLTQPHLLACHDNAVVAERTDHDLPLEIWRTRSLDGQKTWTGVFNRSTAPATFDLNPRRLGFTPGAPITDIWTGQTLTPADDKPIPFPIEPDGVRFLFSQT